MNRGRPPSAILTYELADIIASLATKGYTLKEIAMLRNMPRIHVLYYWTKKYDYFRSLLKSVRTYRKESEEEARVYRILDRLAHL